jgi:hypothetical protein
VTDERRERVAHNELVFRRANDRLRDDWRRLGLGEDEKGLFLCECGDVTCKQPVRVRLADYETVRSDSAAFVVIAGHEDETVESVVDDLIAATDGFVVVRKHAEAPK